MSFIAMMKLPIVTLSVALATCVLYVLLGAMPEVLIWHHGEGHSAWQWLTAHFVHISIEHLLWNVVALVLLGSIIEQNSRIALLLALLAGVIGVNVYLALFYTLNAYAGLSGVLNAVLVVALYQLYLKPGYKFASALTFVLSVLKVAVEYQLNLSLFSTLPWPPVPQAHFAGLLAGVGLVLLLIDVKRIVENRIEEIGR